MKKGKKVFLYTIIGLLVCFIAMLFIRWNRLDDTFLYADILGVFSEEVTDVVFSVDLADIYKEETEVNLYIQNEFVNEMKDNGEDGDKVAGDHIYSCRVSLKIPAGECEEYYAAYGHKKTNIVTIRGFEDITEESIEESNSTITDIYNVAKEYEDEATGYVAYTDISKAVQEVYKAAKAKQKTGEILDIHSEDDSVSLRTSNGIWYVYQPKIEGVEALGSNADLQIITMQPWNSFGTEHLLENDKFISAARKAENTFENVTYTALYEDREVTLDVINTMSKNQVILINTHGGYDSMFGPFLSTGQTYKFSEEFSMDAIAGRIIMTGKPNDVDGRLCITAGYVEKYLGNLSNSMVYMGACKSFMDHRLANSFKDKGADVVMGFTDTVIADYDRAMITSIMEVLCTYSESDSEYGNIGQALAYARKVNGEDDSEYILVDEEEKDNKPARLVYIGAKEYRLYNQYIADFEKYMNELQDTDTYEPEETLVEKPDFAVTAFGNLTIYMISGHGFVAHFEDQGTDEANQEAVIKVKDYINAYVSGKDVIFKDHNISQIRPVSKAVLQTEMFINRTIWPFFDDSHSMGEEQALWRYFIYCVHNYYPEKSLEDNSNAIVKPAKILYEEKSLSEWLKILILNKEPE